MPSWHAQNRTSGWWNHSSSPPLWSSQNQGTGRSGSNQSWGGWHNSWWHDHEPQDWWQQNSWNSNYHQPTWASDQQPSDPPDDATEKPEQQSPTSRPAKSKLAERGRHARFWCYIHLHKAYEDFELVPALIGKGGCNMKEIYTKAKCKVRVRGRGSGHRELEGGREAPVPLMAAVTARRDDAQDFVRAIKLTLSRLEAVTTRFREFCGERGLSHEGHQLFSIGGVAKGAERLLAEALGCGEAEDVASCLGRVPWASERLKAEVLEAVETAPEEPVLGEEESGEESGEGGDLAQLMEQSVAAYLNDGLGESALE